VRVGLLLAGGKSRRMGGGDKFLREIEGARLIDRTRARIDPQVDQTLVSVNGNADSVVDLGLPIVEDSAILAGHGPLVGILAGLRWAAEHVGGNALIVSVPSDTPFVPRDLVLRLEAARLAADAEIGVASSSGRLHYAVAAWPPSLADELEAWLLNDSGSAIRAFLHTRRIAVAEFTAPYDPFLNVNAPEDIGRARSIQVAFSP
jgi:molybdopterin-guanine dinucleotide biosynthesis protein A